MEAGGDFADELVVARARADGCMALATFDTALQGRHPAFVIKPK
jgi:rRNA-processing protein FCF1